MTLQNDIPAISFSFPLTDGAHVGGQAENFHLSSIQVDKLGAS